YQGVIADLGRDKDTALLSTDDVIMLQELLEEVSGDVEDRKDNGALVIAKLLHRCPDTNRKSITKPLARRLVESPNLRWRLGVQKIGKVLNETVPIEC